MAHIPKEDIDRLWNDAGHSWEQLHDQLEKRQGKEEGIEDALVSNMLQASERLARSNEPFPESSDQLYEVMNREAA